MGDPNINIIQSVKTKNTSNQQAYNPRQGLNIPIDDPFLNFDSSKVIDFRKPIVPEVDSLMTPALKEQQMTVDEMMLKAQRDVKRKWKMDEKRMEQGDGRYFKY